MIKIGPHFLLGYYDKIKETFQSSINPHLLINMDETEWGSREDYKQYKSCIIPKADDSLFFFRDEMIIYIFLLSMTAVCT